MVTHFRSLDKIARASEDELLSVEGIGEVVAESIVDWFAEKDNQDLLNKFNKLGVEPISPKLDGQSLAGKYFVISGTLSSIDREAAADKIRSNGGVFQSSVGKDTTYLVTGENPGKSKLDKATKLDIKVIDESEFNKLFKD